MAIKTPGEPPFRFPGWFRRRSGSNGEFHGRRFLVSILRRCISVGRALARRSAADRNAATPYFSFIVAKVGGLNGQGQQPRTTFDCGANPSRADFIFFFLLLRFSFCAFRLNFEPAPQWSLGPFARAPAPPPHCTQRDRARSTCGRYAPDAWR